MLISFYIVFSTLINFFMGVNYLSQNFCKFVQTFYVWILYTLLYFPIIRKLGQVGNQFIFFLNLENQIIFFAAYFLHGKLFHSAMSQQRKMQLPKMKDTMSYRILQCHMVFYNVKWYFSEWEPGCSHFNFCSC